MPDRLAVFVEKMPPKVRWGIAVGFVMGVVLLTAFLLGLSVLQRQQIQDQRSDLAALQAKQAAEDRARMVAQNTSQVTQCINEASTTPDFNKALLLLQTLSKNQLNSAELGLRTDPNGSLTQARRQIVTTIKPALPAVERLVASTSTSRNIGNCRALARKLNVDIQPLLGRGVTP